ncbi:MAG: arginine--tRNA ligase [Anaerolineaceae bacterium]
MFDRQKANINVIITDFCKERGLPAQKAELRNIPFSGEWGVALPIFPLAAADPARKGPVPAHAQALAEALKEALGTLDGFSRIEAMNGYLNLYFSAAEYAQEVVETVIAQGQMYGSQPQQGKPTMIEYSNPNTHKPLHVGHLRNVILGGAVSNLLEASGKSVIRANYIGDIGLHVIKWMCNYEMFHAGEQPGADKMRWMADLYAEADKRFVSEPDFEASVRAYFTRWDAGEQHLKDLWKLTRNWSMEGFEQVYALLGEHFDRIYFESEVEEPGKALVDRLIKDGLAEDGRPENPVIIDLDKKLGTQEEFRVVVILRSDGTSLYATKEIPLAMMKFGEYDLDHSIYVIDVRQSLHMKQMKKVLELMGFEWAPRIQHLAYEIVNLPGNVTMSSRDGTVVLLDDLIREATDRAYAIVKEKNPDLAESDMHEVALQVALGAIKYPMISRENTKIVTFDWETALDFNGQSAPYIQYAHVRANSILRKAGAFEAERARFDYELQPSEVNLIELISRLPDEVTRAAKELKPSLIATYAYELAKGFSDFYNQCQVLNAPENIRTARLTLVIAARIALYRSLALIGIKAPQIM